MRVDSPIRRETPRSEPVHDLIAGIVPTGYELMEPHFRATGLLKNQQLRIGIGRVAVRVRLSARHDRSRNAGERHARGWLGLIAQKGDSELLRPFLARCIDSADRENDVNRYVHFLRTQGGAEGTEIGRA